MIEIPQKIVERALLVALIKGNVDSDIVKEHLDELEELASTAGAETVRKIVQAKYSADPAFYIGKGKAGELIDVVEKDQIDVMIFDDDLSPTQVRNLERTLNRKIIDRSGLILDIFASRAKTREAKTQVELAQLQYLLPRLTRAWTHLSKQYGGIGTKGPGETQIETDRRIIRNRISHLKENLKRIESQRNIQTRGREEFTRICLVGYTNAGKSTLFNRLTDSGVLAEDKLFATLDSTTRAINFNKNSKILLSDTVGFIRKLPAHLVASFKSTLNEVRDADVILHVVDISHHYFEDHIKVVDETLKDLSSDKKTIIRIFNKVDILKDRQKISYVMNSYENGLIISAEKGINIPALVDKLIKISETSFVEENIALSLEDSKTAAKIHSLAEVLDTKYDDSKIHIKYKTNRHNSDKIKKMVHGK
ncbi:MAG: GTPase HflX [Ignavibacteria bacterium GWB2_36_8]|nr:MAG: GTPase HflX [Ignavibacteria bacterium GWB2_36_8]OGU52851.1 MAG: GTPase HflX [Ignavibacteria bacterium GWC2_36_12]